MCGIAGFIDRKGIYSPLEQRRIVSGMLKEIRHRGGEASGIKSVGSATMGHTRLSITDGSRVSNQPIDSDGLSLAFNGEIYNHLDLRRRYLPESSFRSRSDTHTLVHLLRVYPTHLVLKEMHGMYAVSILDQRQGSLTLAVDKFGIKPLYYVHTADYFAWASEIKAFRALPGMRFALRSAALPEYLRYRSVYGGATLYKRIHALRAGERLAYSLKQHHYRKRTYAEIESLQTRDAGSLEEVLKRSIADHLMGDTAPGIQLSGGVDSSLVAILASKTAGKRLHTFSIGLKDRGWNEFSYSDRVAKLIKSRHHKIVFSPQNFVETLSEVTKYLDEPIVHANTVPMHMLARHARKYVKALLTGEGADELFLGYRRYQTLGRASGAERILSSNAFFPSRQAASRLLKKTSDHRALTRRARLLKRLRHETLHRRISIYDLYTYLPHVLARQDGAGMGANLENRTPFLYEPVVSFALGITEKNRLGEKDVLKGLASQYLPRDIVRREKCGFGLPIADWLKNGVLQPYAAGLASHPVIKKHFKTKEIKKLAESHIAGRSDHSEILFSLVALCIWHDTCLK